MAQYPPVMRDLPAFLYGGDYNPEQWIREKDTVWKKDMELARRAGINTLSVGIFSWSMLEPEEGEYRFEWLDEVMDMLAENGMKAVLATPSGARPPWMAEKYPEVLRVDGYRRRQLFGNRHNHCLSSPVYREKVRAINTLLAERYKDHPALGMWHVSNELGGECHCPLCQERSMVEHLLEPPVFLLRPGGKPVAHRGRVQPRAEARLAAVRKRSVLRMVPLGDGTAPAHHAQYSLHHQPDGNFLGHQLF